MSTTDVLATEDPGTHLMAYPVESIHRLLEQANSGQLPERWLRSPFVGSRAFQEADVDSYFGRERELDELLRAIPNYRGVVAIEGEAGSGKTSLLRAGLLPRLPEELRALVFTPGDAPLESLARAIVELRFDRNLESMGLEKLVDALAFDDEWFANWVREYLQSEGAKTLVLIVDQFEELLRHSREEFELAWNRLLAVRESGLVALVITVQSTALDRLGRAAPRLEKSIEQRIVLGPFEPDQAERAIVEPAKMREVTVDDEFVRMITADVVGSPSLLQFVLHRLWPDLTFENYRSLGGAVGLAAERAETVYQSFASETAEIALRLLVMLAGELEAISLDEARRVAPKNVEGVDRAINSFVGIGVLDPTDPESRFYRIFDPAFPRAWPRLRDELEPPPAAESMSMS